MTDNVVNLKNNKKKIVVGLDGWHFLFELFKIQCYFEMRIKHSRKLYSFD